MPKRARRGTSRPRAYLLSIEPLEDRQLLSGLHPAGGEYGNHPAHAAHPPAAAESYREYAHPARMTVTENYGRASSDQAPATSGQAGADLTPGDGAAGYDSYSSSDSSAAQQDASSTSAAASQANARAAGAAVVQHSEATQTAQPGAAPAAERPQPPPADAGPGRGTAAPVVVADAGRSAADRDPVRAARRGTADAPEPLSPPAAGRGIEVERDAEESLDPGTDLADPQAAPSPQVASLLTGSAPVDLPALDRGVDHFFSRLEDLGKELPSGPVLLRLAPWLVAVSAATAALELARWQMKKQSPSRSPRIGRPYPEEA